MATIKDTVRAVDAALPFYFEDPSGNPVDLFEAKRE